MMLNDEAERSCTGGITAVERGSSPVVLPEPSLLAAFPACPACPFALESFVFPAMLRCRLLSSFLPACTIRPLPRLYPYTL